MIQKWPDYNFNNIDASLKIVISSDKELKLNLPFQLAISPKAAVEKAIASGFSRAILAGGSTINSAFMVANLIDEVVVNIEPVILGSGIHIFGESEFEKRLSLIGVEKITADILQVSYKVNKN